MFTHSKQKAHIDCIRKQCAEDSVWTKDENKAAGEYYITCITLYLILLERWNGLNRYHEWGKCANAYTALVGNPQEGDHLRDLQEDNSKTYLREVEYEGVDLTKPVQYTGKYWVFKDTIMNFQVL
jgi:bisphosphoglycerate-independent phosphoglycerate mutase (AlkP superfamily)